MGCHLVWIVISCTTPHRHTHRRVHDDLWALWGATALWDSPTVAPLLVPLTSANVTAEVRMQSVFVVVRCTHMRMHHLATYVADHHEPTNTT